MNNQENDRSMPVHRLLRLRRRALELTQADLAESLSVDAATVSQWETRHRRMELAKVPRLAEALHLDPKELCRSALKEWYPSVFAAIFNRESTQPPASSGDAFPGDTPLEPGVIVGDSLRQPEQLPQ